MPQYKVKVKVDGKTKVVTVKAKDRKTAEKFVKRYPRSSGANVDLT